MARSQEGSGTASGPGRRCDHFHLAQSGPSIRVVRSLIPILRDDGVVILPTDTVYGFSGRFDRAEPHERIRAIKGRADSGPLLSLVSGPEMAFRYAEPPRGPSYELLLRYWPGPLTVVLRARPHVPPAFCGPGDTLAFRWPVTPFLQALLGALGVPLLSTSANLRGQPTPRVVAPLVELFGGSVDAIVDGGDLPGIASTVVDLTGQDPVILRQGTLRLEPGIAVQDPDAPSA